MANLVLQKSKVYRVSRGGGWNNAAWICGSSLPIGRIPSRRFINVGFRVVKEVKPLEEVDPPARVGRGGGCSNSAWICGLSYRDYLNPLFRLNDLGFRVVKEVKPSERVAGR